MKNLRVAFSIALCFCIFGCSEQSTEEPMVESPAADTVAEEPMVESPVADTAAAEPMVESPVADTAAEMQPVEMSREQSDASGQEPAETQGTENPLEPAERAALAAIRAIATAEFSFFQANNRFASLAELSEEYIVKTLASGEKGGYTFTINTSEGGFEAIGMPKEQGVTGVKAYFVDQSGNILSTDDGTTPDAASPTDMSPF